MPKVDCQVYVVHTAVLLKGRLFEVRHVACTGRPKQRSQGAQRKEVESGSKEKRTGITMGNLGQAICYIRSSLAPRGGWDCSGKSPLCTGAVKVSSHSSGFPSTFPREVSLKMGPFSEIKGLLWGSPIPKGCEMCWGDGQIRGM